MSSLRTACCLYMQLPADAVPDELRHDRIPRGFHMRHFQAKKSRNSGAISKRLVIGHRYTWDCIERFFGSNEIFMSIAIEMLRCQMSVMNLIVNGFIESDGEGFDLLGCSLPE